VDPYADKTPEKKASRPAGLKIGKFLEPDEEVTYSTRGTLYVDGDDGLRGYVTDRRVIFYAGKGFLSRPSRLYEISLKRIYSYNIIEVGLLIKKMHLQLNDLKISGDVADISGLFEAIRTAKQSSE
jgi:hypothetical protein